MTLWTINKWAEQLYDWDSVNIQYDNYLYTWDESYEEVEVSTSWAIA